MAKKIQVEMTPTELGRRIRAAREATSMSQQLAATRAKVSVRAWARWETGVGMPRLPELHRAAEVLGTTAASLLT